MTESDKRVKILLFKSLDASVNRSRNYEADSENNENVNWYLYFPLVSRFTRLVHIQSKFTHIFHHMLEIFVKQWH